jgi:hypothetical protein
MKPVDQVKCYTSMYVNLVYEKLNDKYMCSSFGLRCEESFLRSLEFLRLRCSGFRYVNLAQYRKNYIVLRNEYVYTIK